MSEAQALFQHPPSFMTWKGPIDQEGRDFEVLVEGDLTVCLRKQDGAWKIVHEHASAPFHMDGSFRAAIDQTP